MKFCKHFIHNLLTLSLWHFIANWTVDLRAGAMCVCVCRYVCVWVYVYFGGECNNAGFMIVMAIER